MMDINIVTLNIPYPPDYGGMIDTYYRIRTLHESGVRIHLQCFEYGRSHSEELESYCESTTYYLRKASFLNQFSSIPYIVSSRQSANLLENLNKNNFPILFDGLHTTYYLNHPDLSDRIKLVRLHNIEHRYYESLATNEKNFLKKLYFTVESIKLKKYEKVIANADYILPISESDHEYFSHKYGNSVMLPPFHPFYGFEGLPGIGDYLIYHADLSVNENTVIAKYLISNIFSKLPFKCIVAGKNPPDTIKFQASVYSNIKVVSNPDGSEMKHLIKNAQINLLPRLTNNGYKIKLLFALYAGRHCLVNSVKGVDNLIKKMCHIANSDSEIINKIHFLMHEEFTIEMIHERNKILSENFDLKNSAKKLIDLISLAMM